MHESTAKNGTGQRTRAGEQRAHHTPGRSPVNDIHVNRASPDSLRNDLPVPHWDRLGNRPSGCRHDARHEAHPICNRLEKHSDRQFDPVGQGRRSWEKCAEAPGGAAR